MKWGLHVRCHAAKTNSGGAGEKAHILISAGVFVERENAGRFANPKCVKRLHPMLQPFYVAGYPRGCTCFGVASFGLHLFFARQDESDLLKKRCLAPEVLGTTRTSEAFRWGWNSQWAGCWPAVHCALRFSMQFPGLPQMRGRAMLLRCERELKLRGGM